MDYGHTQAGKVHRLCDRYTDVKKLHPGNDVLQSLVSIKVSILSKSWMKAPKEKLLSDTNQLSDVTVQPQAASGSAQWVPDSLCYRGPIVVSCFVRT